MNWKTIGWLIGAFQCPMVWWPGVEWQHAVRPWINNELILFWSHPNNEQDHPGQEDVLSYALTFQQNHFGRRHISSMEGGKNPSCMIWHVAIIHDIHTDSRRFPCRMERNKIYYRTFLTGNKRSWWIISKTFNHVVVVLCDDMLLLKRLKLNEPRLLL